MKQTFDVDAMIAKMNERPDAAPMGKHPFVRPVLERYFRKMPVVLGAQLDFLATIATVASAVVHCQQVCIGAGSSGQGLGTAIAAVVPDDYLPDPAYRAVVASAVETQLVEKSFRFMVLVEHPDATYSIVGKTADEVVASWRERLSPAMQGKLDAGTLTIGELLQEAPSVVILGDW